MKKYLLIITAFLIILSGCKKSTTQPIIANGTYSGVIKVSSSVYKLPTTIPISISFNNEKFAVIPDPTRKPATGSGTYSSKDGTANFTDSNVYTADFDWNLILNGEYTIEISGNNLMLTKQFKPTQPVNPAVSYAVITYQYILTKN